MGGGAAGRMVLPGILLIMKCDFMGTFDFCLGFLMFFFKTKIRLTSFKILQVTPLMWLDAWLDNVMESVPELAICYHHNGVVQGYELLKTDEIFLLKGIAEDGTVVFHPQVVQQNGLSVLKFLQDNCKQDPGSYWVSHCLHLTLSH